VSSLYTPRRPADVSRLLGDKALGEFLAKKGLLHLLEEGGVLELDEVADADDLVCSAEHAGLHQVETVGQVGRVPLGGGRLEVQTHQLHEFVVDVLDYRQGGAAAFAHVQNCEVPG
jgi:hypothetical protein